MSALEDLITELARLPGLGRKSAQRIAYHLLQQPAERGRRLAETLLQVGERVHPCAECGAPAEAERCEICLDPRRDPAVICVVEEPSGMQVVEHSTEFRGRYHVLGGRLSPLDGVGPERLRVDALLKRVEGGAVREIILATNPSMEGEVTATYLQQRLAGKVGRITRLARGLPVGGDLEYVDGVTMAHALQARQELR
ncbi:MAG TPA: recombination mediator RecR [Gemmatimonadales bacterium]|nr:recombination mediator RecR [Gemmatimonadales bacterium]